MLAGTTTPCLEIEHANEIGSPPSIHGVANAMPFGSHFKFKTHIHHLHKCH